MINYYEVLEIESTATEKEIKSAYRKLAKKWHPDTTQFDKEYAANKFKEITIAYNILSDSEKRKNYDYNLDYEIRHEAESRRQEQARQEAERRRQEQARQEAERRRQEQARQEAERRRQERVWQEEVRREQGKRKITTNLYSKVINNIFKLLSSNDKSNLFPMLLVFFLLYVPNLFFNMKMDFVFDEYIRPIVVGIMALTTLILPIFGSKILKNMKIRTPNIYLKLELFYIIIWITLVFIDVLLWYSKTILNNIYGEGSIEQMEFMVYKNINMLIKLQPEILLDALLGGFVLWIFSQPFKNKLNLYKTLKYILLIIVTLNIYNLLIFN